MIQVRIGSLHDVDAEALMRPVSSELAAVTGVGRDVDLRIGEEIHERLRALGTIPVGSAVVTPGGDLDVPFIIHVAVQSREEAVTEAGIARALLNGLRRASEWDMNSVALPPLGTGAGNLDPDTSAAVMLPVLASHLRAETHPGTITIVVPGEYEEEIFVAALDRLEAGSAVRSDEEVDAAGTGEVDPAEAGQPGEEEA